MHGVGKKATTGFDIATKADVSVSKSLLDTQQSRKVVPFSYEVEDNITFGNNVPLNFICIAVEVPT